MQKRKSKTVNQLVYVGLRGYFALPCQDLGSNYKKNQRISGGKRWQTLKKCSQQLDKLIVFKTTTTAAAAAATTATTVTAKTARARTAAAKTARARAAAARRNISKRSRKKSSIMIYPSSPTF
jgi:hypothetical protein